MCIRDSSRAGEVLGKEDDDQIISALCVVQDSGIIFYIGKLAGFVGNADALWPVSYTHLDVYKRQIPYGSRIKIMDGQVMEAGDELTEGSVNPHDILRIKGVQMCIRDRVKDFRKQKEPSGE